MISFFKHKTPEQIHELYFKEIMLPFEESYLKKYNIDQFLYMQCNKKLNEISKTVPQHIYEYVDFTLIADDFYKLHKPLFFTYKNISFITLNYLNSYNNFLIPITREHND